MYGKLYFLQCTFIATIYDHATGKIKHGKPPGPLMILTPVEESMWIFDMAKIGYRRSSEELRLAVKKILDKDGWKNPFTNNMPGYGWLNGFMKRHPQISLRQAESLSMSCSLEMLSRWFDDFHIFCKNNLIDKAERLWNADESGFPLQYRSGKVLSPCESKYVYSVNNSSKQQITTLVCINAAGQVMPPMHIFPGEQFHYNPLEGGVYGTYFGRSSPGWMDSELFYGWLMSHFVVCILPMRPVVLILDGHSSHDTCSSTL